MLTLHVFESISLDGYFTGANGDLNWAYAAPADDEWNKWVSGNAQGGGALVLGRATYDMMASHWPTEQARKTMPEVAEGMNRMTKYVFSRTMKSASWSKGRTVFEGITEPPRLALTRTRAFKNGNVVLEYETIRI